MHSFEKITNTYTEKNAKVRSILWPNTIYIQTHQNILDTKNYLLHSKNIIYDIFYTFKYQR